MKIEDLLTDSAEGGVALVSEWYAEDVKQLAENAKFQRFVLEIPPGYDFEDYDRHSFTMMLNRKCDSEGLDFHYIGTPRKAMRRVWEAVNRL
jgi:hypothetical protein